MTEQDWNFPEGRFLAYALGPLEQETAAALHRAQCRAADRSSSLSRHCRTAAAGAWKSRTNTTAATGRNATVLDCGTKCGGAGPFCPGLRGRSMTRCLRFGARSNRRWRDLPAVGAGGHSRSSCCSVRRIRCGAAGRLARDCNSGRTCRHALQVPHRRRARGAGSRLAFPARTMSRARAR